MFYRQSITSGLQKEALSLQNFSNSADGGIPIWHSL
jgi:hypothetical protein